MRNPLETSRYPPPLRQPSRLHNPFLPIIDRRILKSPYGDMRTLETPSAKLFFPRHFKFTGPSTNIVTLLFHKADPICEPSTGSNLTGPDRPTPGAFLDFLVCRPPPSALLDSAYVHVYSSNWNEGVAERLRMSEISKLFGICENGNGCEITSLLRL